MLLNEEISVIDRDADVRSRPQAHGLDAQIAVKKIGRKRRVFGHDSKRRRRLRLREREGRSQRDAEKSDDKFTHEVELLKVLTAGLSSKDFNNVREKGCTVSQA